MAQQFVDCLEELSIHAGEVKELEGLIQRFNINMSSKKKSTRIYKNNVETHREAGNYKKNMQKKLGNITAERYYFEKSATLPIFEQGYPT